MYLTSDKAKNSQNTAKNSKCRNYVGDCKVFRVAPRMVDSETAANNIRNPSPIILAPASVGWCMASTAMNPRDIGRRNNREHS